MMQSGIAYREPENGLAVVGQRFTDLQTLTVKQRKNWWELLVNFEAKNRYVVLGNRMGAAFEVEEQGEGLGELLKRLFLGTARGNELGEIIGPFFKPWTFELTVGGRVIGHIKKKWSGLLKEAFTDADNFEVEFAPDTDPRWKALALAAAVLLDVVHFERAKNG